MSKGFWVRKGRRRGRWSTGTPRHHGTGGRRHAPPSLHTIAQLFPEESLQRVYFHGLWQRSRGRQPSLTLHNQRNPRLAFAAAQELVGEYLDRVRQFPDWRERLFWNRYKIQKIRDHRSLDQIFPSFWDLPALSLVQNSAGD